MRNLKLISKISLVLAALLLLGACAAPADLSTAGGRLEHEGRSQAGGGVIPIDQFADDMNEARIAGVLAGAQLSAIADYEIYENHSLIYGIVVSFTDQEIIDMINRAIDGDEDAIEEFLELVTYFEEDIGRPLSHYNGRFLLRAFSPEVEDMLFRLWHRTAAIEIIEGIDAFSHND